MDTSGQVGPKPEALHKLEVPYTPCRLMKAGGNFLLISRKSRPLSCRFKMSLPNRRQWHFRGNADRAYNTLHFAPQSRVQKGALPPFDTPTRNGDTLPLNGARTAVSCYQPSGLNCHRQGKRELWFHILNYGKLLIPIWRRPVSIPPSVRQTAPVSNFVFFLSIVNSLKNSYYFLLLQNIFINLFYSCSGATATNLMYHTGFFLLL